MCGDMFQTLVKYAKAITMARVLPLMSMSTMTVVRFWFINSETHIWLMSLLINIQALGYYCLRSHITCGFLHDRLLMCAGCSTFPGYRLASILATIAEALLACCKLICVNPVKITTRMEGLVRLLLQSPAALKYLRLLNQTWFWRHQGWCCQLWLLIKVRVARWSPAVSPEF